MRFDLHILGCGAAMPANGLHPTCQVLNVNERFFMIDCGEGAQSQLRKQKISFQKIKHIFISHMHGDHIFGLPGLISSMHLLGRTKDLHIHGPEALQSFLEGVFKSSSGHKLPFELEFHVVDPTISTLVYEDKAVEVYSLPLIHRAPTAGYLFREKKHSLNLIKEMIVDLKIPIAQIKAIKEGADYFDEASGKTFKNTELTLPRKASRSYAFCSDTAPNPALIPIIKDVDLLYHEATFMEDNLERAAKTQHSTAKQAAEIAALANVGQLLLGHFSARYQDLSLMLEEARPYFENTHLSQEGKVYSV